MSKVLVNLYCVLSSSVLCVLACVRMQAASSSGALQQQPSSARAPTDVERELRTQVMALQAQLHEQQRRATQDWYAQQARLSAASSAAGSPAHPGQPGGARNKKQEDPEGLDPESAALHGAATTFQPMAGLVRGRAGRCSPVMTPVLPLLQALDRAGLFAYRRPEVRLAFTIYLFILHIVTLVAVF